MLRSVNKGGPPLYSHNSATPSPIGAVPDPLSGSQSLRIKPPLKIRLGRPLVTCHAQSPIDTLTKRDRTAPVSACMPARWLSKQLIWLADSKRVQGLTGLTRTRSSRVHSYRLHTACHGCAGRLLEMRSFAIDFRHGPACTLGVFSGA